MYGFESSVLIALHGGAVLDAGRPFFPADIAAALARVPAPRVLVTTPFHLKAVLDAGLALPPLALRAVRDRAALAAARGRGRGAPAARRWSRSTAAPRPARSRRGEPPPAPSGAPSTASASPATATRSRSAAATCRSRRCSPTCSRSPAATPSACSAGLHDLINVAGKRSSIGHLNFQLNSIDGVVDGAFWMPPDDSGDARGIVRLVAFVVAPALSNASDRRRAARARRRGLPAAPDRPRRRTAARGDRQADGGAARRAGGTPAARSAMSDAVARGERSRSPPTIRRSTATSPGSRCCPASPCWPKCSRRRAPSRRLRAASARRRAWRW